MKRFLKALVICSVVTGCAATPVPVHSEVFFSVKLVDTLPKGVYGTAKCTTTNLCRIEIRRDTYPNCIQHEIRHGFEGNWHPGYETTWDC